MTDPILQVRNLRKVYGARGAGRATGSVAVDDVSFDVASGSSLGIVGESGSGKTTTARIIAGLETADAGTLTVDGESVILNRRFHRAPSMTQMVFQDPLGSLDPRQRIGAAIDELLSIGTSLDRSARRSRVVDLLDQVGLDPQHGEEYPRNLSGGQRQRAAIARALALQPRILILDEAVSALDVSVQAQVLNLLSDIRRDTAITYLFVSHDLAVIRQICDNCIVMRGGRLVEQGSTADVLANPAEDYTRQLLNSVPRPGWRPQRSTVVRGEVTA